MKATPLFRRTDVIAVSRVFITRMTPALAVAGLFVTMAPDAQAQVYRCESTSGGPPVYQSSPGNNCKAVHLTPLTTIPATRAAPAARVPGAAASSAGGSGGSAQGGTSSGAAASASSSSFPRVDVSAQRARDTDRRRILEEELRKEESRLGELRAEYKEGEPDRLGNERNYQKYLDRVERLRTEIIRSEANVGSIKQELGAIR